MKTYLAYCILTFFTLISFAQSPDKNIVLAKSGLNLREAPNENARILDKIPFKTAVTFISCDENLVDIPNVYHSQEYDHWISRGIFGYWVKIQYKLQTGFVFSAFLGNEDFFQEATQLNEGFHYGFYESNGFWTIDQIADIFYTYPDGRPAISQDYKRPYDFVFLHTDSLQSGITPFPMKKLTCNFPNSDINLKNELQSAGLSLFPQLNKKDIISVSKENRIAFQLNHYTNAFPQSNYRFTLLAFGDIDGDKKNDYYYQWDGGCAQQRTTFIWLSSYCVQLPYDCSGSLFEKQASLNLKGNYSYVNNYPNVASGYYYVIAKSGLLMRTSRKSDAPVIMNIPCGEKVRVLLTENPVLDTLGVGAEYYDENMNEIKKEYIVGIRVLASYKGKTGYVHSSYLMSSPATVPKGNFCFFAAGNSAYYYHPDWNYYSFYHKGGKFKVEKIELSMFTKFGYDEVFGHHLMSCFQVKGNYPEFIIGSKMPINIAENEKYLETLSVNNLQNNEFSDSLIFQLFHLKTQYDETSENNILTAVRNNGSQQEIRFEDGRINTATIPIWYGDIDHDGELDYIFRFEYGEVCNAYVLFISSEGGKGKILKWSYFHGYCSC